MVQRTFRGERTRETGIKKALGAEDRTIVGEFLTESGLIGFGGRAADAWFGWIVASLLNALLAPRSAAPASGT